MQPTPHNRPGQRLPTTVMMNQEASIQCLVLGNSRSYSTTRTTVSFVSGDPETSPYAAVVASSGPMAKINPFRFSTKWWDEETGLGWWGYRFYDSGTGRWVGRDPIGEEGGKNLYQYIVNPVQGIDILGMKPLTPLNPYTAGCQICPSDAKKKSADPGSTCPKKYRTNQSNGREPTVNGCGSASFDVPDSFFGMVSFTPACNNHDRCYGQCGASKVECDVALGLAMRKACLPLMIFPPLYGLCAAQADIYTAILIAAPMADEAFNSSQDEMCEWSPCCD